jgi:hypothetical protein
VLKEWARVVWKEAVIGTWWPGCGWSAVSFR